MVIGNGLIAQRFEAYATDDRFIIFASGVSNSKSADHAAFEREKVLLSQTMANQPGKKLVYFSTCSVYDPVEKNSAYAAHKLQLEMMIRETAGSYTIFRLSNLAGLTPNHNTILNFLVNSIREKRHFDLWKNATRNIIDIDDAYLVIDYILQQHLFENEIVNIASTKSYPVSEMTTAIEIFLQIPALYTPIDKGVAFDIDLAGILPLVSKLGIAFGDNYFSNLLGKYYSPRT